MTHSHPKQNKCTQQPKWQTDSRAEVADTARQQDSRTDTNTYTLSLSYWSFAVATHQRHKRHMSARHHLTLHTLLLTPHFDTQTHSTTLIAHVLPCHSCHPLITWQGHRPTVDWTGTTHTMPVVCGRPWPLLQGLPGWSGLWHQEDTACPAHHVRSKMLENN